MGIADDVSTDYGNNDGFTYCGERSYSTRLVEIGRFVTQLGNYIDSDERVTNDGPLLFRENGLSLEIDATSQSDIGIYTYHLEVNLQDYMSNDYSLKRIGVFPFQIYVFHNCA